jgi:hypothetical protein
MADNIAVTEGSGKDVATDDVGGKQYQRVKLDLGGDGVAAPALAGAGAVATGVQRITLASDDPAVALLGTIDTDTGVIAGDTTSIDGKITACNTGAVVISSGTVTTVSTVTNLAQMGGAALAMNEGVLGVGVQRVSLATDDDAVAHLATIAGDTTSLDTKIVVGGGAEAGAVLVTIANDSTGLVSVDDGGSTLSVDDGASSLTVDTTGTSGLEVVQVTAADLNVTEASGGDIKTAVETTAGWDATHAAAAPADGPQIMGAGYSTGLPTDIGADADAARICTDRYGRILRGIMPQNFQATFTSADAQAAAPVKVKTASRKMYILSLVVSVDTEMSVQFQDDTGPTVLIEGMYFAANGGAHLTYPPEAPLVVNTNEDFDVITSAAGNISVTITGYLAI